MTEIIPRWEWRTFAKSIKTRIDLADHPQTRHVESSEIYLSSASAEGNPKIRENKIDIKLLQSINDDGLEKWKPALKSSFPLSAYQLEEVYRALKLDVPPGTDPCDLDALVQIIENDPRTAAVAVDKVRSLYVINGCTVESSLVSFDGERFETIAAEDPDAEKVSNTVAELGLLGHENISYVKAIQRIKWGIAP